MKIHENVLSPELLKKCSEELAKEQNSQGWAISNIIWPAHLQEGLIGNVFIRFLSEETAVDIHKALKKYFSKLDPGYELITTGYEMSYQYYVWNKMAGIANHDDRTYGAGATLYLNTFWDSNWGGLFVWKDKNEKKGYKLNAICPKQNMLIINDEHEVHLVTPTAVNIPYPRITIQIWYEDKR